MLASSIWEKVVLFAELIFFSPSSAECQFHCLPFRYPQGFLKRASFSVHRDSAVQFSFWPSCLASVFAYGLLSEMLETNHPKPI